MKFASLLLIGVSIAAPSLAFTAEGEPPPSRTNFYGRPVPDRAITRLGTTVLNLREISSDAEFSPDGKTIAVHRRDDSVELWDVAAGTMLRQFVEGREISSLRFAPDGKTLVILTGALQLEFWDVAAGKLRSSVAVPVAIPGEKRGNGGARAEFAVSPDGKLVATLATDRVLSLYQMEDGRNLLGRELKIPQKERMVSFSLSFSHDSKRIAAVGGQGNIFVYDIPADRFVHTLTNAHNEFCSFVAFANDDQLLISCGRDRSKPSMERLSECRVWSMADGTRANEASFEQHPWPRLTASGKEFCVGTTDAIEFWEVETLTRTCTIRVPSSHEVPLPTRLLSLSSNDKFAAVGGMQGFEILDLASERLLTFDAAAHRDMVRTIQFTADAKQIVTSSEDGTIRSWDAGTGKQLQNFAVPKQLTFRPQSLVSPDGRTLFATTLPAIDEPVPSKFIVAYDVQSGAEQFRIPVSSANLDPVALSADGRLLALVGTEKKVLDVKLVDLSERKVISEFEAPDRLAGVAFLSDGLTFAGVTSNFTLRHWGIDGKQKESFNILGDAKPFRTRNDQFGKAVRVNRIGEAVFAPRHSLCVTEVSRIDKLVAWNLKDGKKVTEFPLSSTTGHELAISRDERWLAAAHDTDDENNRRISGVRIFDIETGEVRADFQRPGTCYSIAFSPDSRQLAAAQSAPFDVIVWDMSTELNAK